MANWFQAASSADLNVEQMWDDMLIDKCSATLPCKTFPSGLTFLLSFRNTAQLCTITMSAIVCTLMYLLNYRFAHIPTDFIFYNEKNEDKKFFKINFKFIASFRLFLCNHFSTMNQI